MTEDRAIRKWLPLNRGDSHASGSSASDRLRALRLRDLARDFQNARRSAR